MADREQYEVRTTVVKRITVTHRVFATSKAQAVDLVIGGKGERVGRVVVNIIEKPSHRTKKVRTKNARPS